jgi:hypothetical protein
MPLAGDSLIDDEHAIEPLAAIGWRVSTVSWRQTEIPWADFDAVIIRSTWDYWNDAPAFLEIRAMFPEEKLLLRGRQALSMISGSPLYARVDEFRACD